MQMAICPIGLPDFCQLSMIIKILNISFEHDRELKLRAIENCLCAHGEGRHFLWMPISIVENLLRMNILSEYAKRVLHDLKGLVIETRDIERNLDMHAEIDFEQKSGINVSGMKILIGYALAADSETLRSCNILTENIADAEILITASRIAITKMRLANICTASLIKCNGGGNTTYENYLDLKGNGKLFLCVIDSDKHHPNAPHGETARRFKKETSELSDGHQLLIIDAHEIENIIPSKILMDALDPDLTGGIIFNRGKFEFRKYIDHKNGLTVGEAIKHDLDFDSDYWKDFYDEGEDEYLCRPMGSKILNKVLEKMKLQSEHKLAELIDNVRDCEWVRISNIVAAWGISTKRKVL